MTTQYPPELSVEHSSNGVRYFVSFYKNDANDYPQRVTHNELTLAEYVTWINADLVDEGSHVLA